jgi:hypothetical protein
LALKDAPLNKPVLKKPMAKKSFSDDGIGGEKASLHRQTVARPKAKPFLNL